ncbi:SRPBCC family protein [Micromonospora noduli]|uniref:Putative 17.2 kDa protein in melC2-rnhH i ntergenic region n=1 Tax=Micromonospora noduli TaxID=709876 RepID=A0A328NEZ2_9ACTN|nr:SRPBCC family protein [Micromonospora noduli]KAB1924663.1 SRPBCC family protein [Micromonospora noduli]RAO04590.1 putative 17.2 kDa protein in melC2-rnhH i ntergenic region [Micromonospora noduli]RAO07638.1 putative 17.2 kDa protein in melC2-rnhH i ntergenic region [Micromonospora noduli]
MAGNTNAGGLGDKLRGQLADEVRNLAGAIGDRAVSVVTERITGATGRLSEYARQGGGPGLIAAATGAQKLAEGGSPVKAMLHAGVAGGKEKVMSALGRTGGGKGGGKKKKVTNIVETIEVGVPVRAAYNQWTQFGDFPSFMKKVENVDTDSDEKLTWKAQVFWSHRTWESTIVRQVPDKLIHWRSKGEKGSVDGTVSFHEVTPDLTRILVVLEYHPQGLFEHTGNLWRAQGRRVRLELKHFVRHVMTEVVLDPDQVEGWRGEIRDSQVVKDHETGLREEREQRERGQEQRGGAPAGTEDDEFAEDEPAEEEPRRRPSGRLRQRPRRRPVEPEYEEEYEASEDGYDEGYADEPDEEPPPPPRRRAPERARRPQPREEPQRPRPPVRRGPEPPRRPVVRRRREEDE